MSDAQTQDAQHSAWAAENAGDSPVAAELPCEPEPGSVSAMLFVLEMVETLSRNLDFDPSDPTDASHNWVGPLEKLQRDLSTLAAQAASTRWDSSGFSRLLKHATGIRMRPLVDGDKELLRDTHPDRCMVCHANESRCEWAFDLFGIHKRSGSDFLSHRRDETPLEGQRRVYETPLSNEKNEWYGRFAVGRTCLRKVHLAFWCTNFLSMLYADFDERLTTMEYDCMQRRERLPTNSFALATEENARFYVQQLELAKTLIATERTNVRLPEIPLVFESVWREGDVQDHELCKGANDRHAYLQTVLGDAAREHLAGEDDERHEEGSRTKRRRASYFEPDLDETEEAEPPAAPTRRAKKRALVVESDDEDSDGFSRHDTERATAHSFACPGGCCGCSSGSGSVRQPPPPAQPPPVPAAPAQPQPLRPAQTQPAAEEAEEEDDIDDQPQPQDGIDDAQPAAVEDAATKAQRRAVSLVLAIGTDLAGEQHRAMDSEAALRVQQSSDEIAKRLAKEFGFDF